MFRFCWSSAKATSRTHARLISDERGGGSTIEWLGALVLVLILAAGVGQVGRSASNRIGGDAGVDGSGVGSAVQQSRNESRSDTDPSVLLENAGADPRAEDESAPGTTPFPECENSFAAGAWQAFLNGEGQIVGDLVGTTDAELKRQLWNRPAGDVLRDGGRFVMDVAPGVLAAMPGLLGNVRDGAIERMTDGRIVEHTTNGAVSIANMLLIDSVRVVGRLSNDGWNGSRVLIAAARSGDCVLFGQIVRSGVNNVPELTLALLDVVPAAGGAAALAKKAVTAKRVAAGAKGVVSLTKAAVVAAKATAAVAARGVVAATHATPAAARRAAIVAGAHVARGELGLATGIAVAKTFGESAWRAGSTAVAHTSRAAVAGIRAGGHLVSEATTEAGRHMHGAGHGAPEVAHPNVGRLTNAGQPEVFEMRRSALASAAGTPGHPMFGAAGALCFTAGTEVHTPRGLVAIENVRLGQRVTTFASTEETHTAVDASWRRIDLEMQDPRNARSTLRLALLRPSEWLDRARARVGALVDIELAEMQISGRARVIAITNAPDVEQGAGRVVLSTVVSESADVLVLRFLGTNETLEPTHTHPLYSLDRDGWVSAGKLHRGERLPSADGVAVVTSIERKPGVHTVYNFEVETDHEYLVGKLGVRSHNDCAAQSLPAISRASRAVQLREAEALLAARVNAANLHGGVGTLRLKPMRDFLNSQVMDRVLSGPRLRPDTRARALNAFVDAAFDRIIEPSRSDLSMILSFTVRVLPPKAREEAMWRIIQRTHAPTIREELERARGLVAEYAEKVGPHAPGRRRKNITSDEGYDYLPSRGDPTTWLDSAVRIQQEVMGRRELADVLASTDRMHRALFYDAWARETVRRASEDMYDSAAVEWGYRHGILQLPEGYDGAFEKKLVEGYRDAQRGLAAERRQAGFCFTAGTEVHTPRGLVAIEDVELGDRVTTIGNATDGATAADSTWRRVELEMEDPRSLDGMLYIALLRPLTWIERTNAHVGELLDLDLPEMHLRGEARVTSIGDAPPIEPGSGRLVLSTVVSQSAHVLVLKFYGTDEKLEPTASHPLFSLDRNDWVAAGKLRIGERLRTQQGEVTVSFIERKAGTHTVYNFEVETEHEYLVGKLGVRSHNDCPDSVPPPSHNIRLSETRQEDIALAHEMVGMYADTGSSPELGMQIGRAQAFVNSEFIARVAAIPDLSDETFQHVLLEFSAQVRRWANREIPDPAAIMRETLSKVPDARLQGPMVRALVGEEGATVDDAVKLFDDFMREPLDDAARAAAADAPPSALVRTSDEAVETAPRTASPDPFHDAPAAQQVEDATGAATRATDDTSGRVTREADDAVGARETPADATAPRAAESGATFDVAEQGAPPQGFSRRMKLELLAHDVWRGVYEVGSTAFWTTTEVVSKLPLGGSWAANRLRRVRASFYPTVSPIPPLYYDGVADVAQRVLRTVSFGDPPVNVPGEVATRFREIYDELRAKSVPQMEALSQAMEHKDVVEHLQEFRNEINGRIEDLMMQLRTEQSRDRGGR